MRVIAQLYDFLFFKLISCDLLQITAGDCGSNFQFYFSSPSFSNLENCSRNLDMQELDYNPSKKDLTDARIHHLLAEELKPYRRVRSRQCLSFSFPNFLKFHFIFKNNFYEN